MAAILDVTMYSAAAALPHISRVSDKASETQTSVASQQDETKYDKKAAAAEAQKDADSTTKGDAAQARSASDDSSVQDYLAMIEPGSLYQGYA